ncbi:hypothetical protein WH52_03905 [Tenacibaculum holothuriorum]|uniref:Vacuolar membrane protease n=1 Tax=Tenacibaculum holothuriorum TaxID=1635173 RepID=A0A1Y2PF71_9FLAO|nr:M20/M25/M40 family metallo-hydrolase [Tenacibaculum holothuriorum]OSY88820.1 hypothetical protein WH52_03905 [Tenacibaculum holothuriorum]
MKSLSKLAALLIVVTTIYWSFSDIIPSKNYSEKTEKPTDFSINNALYHLKNISKKSHHVGTDEHKVVQDYLVNELKKLGLKPEVQYQTAINTKWRAGTTAENILARIKGSGNGKALMLLSHYDSNPHSSLGASDAGSGIVTILEGVRAFLAQNKTPKNDIIILFSDAEELGLLGAQAFVEKHPWAKDVGLVLNFEARGSGGSSFMLMETNGKNKTLLHEFMKANPNYPAANSLMYDVYKKLPNDTDLTVFREIGDINGFNFAFIDDHFDYHTAQDSYERLNRETLLHQADYLTTTLSYFANSNLTNLKSDEDYIYTNFPISKLISYPFSWVLPMLIIACILFVLLFIIGLKKRKFTIEGTVKGFIPFLISLVIASAVSFGLWKLLVLIHPQYKDILHGFTYNGHQYIATFVFLTLWILFKIYNYFKDQNIEDLLVAPIVFGLLINFVVFKYLQGAGFLIIPVFISLLVLAILVFKNLKQNSKPILFALISIPSIYIISPMIQLFPVALGLKVLFISAIFTVILFGFILPIFYSEKKKSKLQFLMLFFAIYYFISASMNSGYSVDKKLPNSLVYIQNADTNESYWGTYNNNLDAFTQQVFDDNYSSGSVSFAEGKSKYNTRFTFHKKAKNIKLKNSLIPIEKDTIYNNQRHIDFKIEPQRRINKYEFITNSPLNIEKFTVNGILVNNGKPFTNEGTLLIYQMGNTDKDLNISLTIDENEKPNITLNEISYDLLNNTELNIKPRSENMMPMPFVTNDAIISSRKLKL